MAAVTKNFVDAVKGHFDQPGAKWLILGDSGHGMKSLIDLAHAADQGTLKLKDLGIKAILFEGARKGQEATADRGKYNAAVTVLRKHVAIVAGCEDDKSLATEAEFTQLLENPVPDIGVRSQNLLDRRVGEANDTWTSALTPYTRAILCCGSSHLSHFDNGQGMNDLGLVKRLGFKGMTAGYVVEESNSGAGDGLYYPEWSGQGAKKFGAVEAIHPYPGRSATL
jgi:hypothetical protein